MTFVLVDHGSANWVLGTTTTGAMNTGPTNPNGPANLMVAVGGGDSHTITDSNGNTWTDIFGGVVDGFSTYVMQYVSNPTVGTGHTVSILSGGRISLCVTAWGGAASSSPLDTNSANASGAASGSLGAGSITPSQANSLGIAAAGDIFQAGAPLTVNFGTISDIADPTIGDFANGAMAYEIQTTATARNYTWSWTGATGVHIVVLGAFFKPGTGVVAPTFSLDTLFDQPKLLRPKEWQQFPFGSTASNSAWTPAPFELSRLLKQPDSWKQEPITIPAVTNAAFVASEFFRSAPIKPLSDWQQFSYFPRVIVTWSAQPFPAPAIKFRINDDATWKAATFPPPVPIPGYPLDAWFTLPLVLRRGVEVQWFTPIKFVPVVSNIVPQRTLVGVGV